MIQRRYNDERGIAMVIALALDHADLRHRRDACSTVTSGEASRSRRDVKTTGAYQAAEPGTNAYLSDLTESTVFFNSYLAKGEATRTDSEQRHAREQQRVRRRVELRQAPGPTRRTLPTIPAGSISATATSI